MYTVLDIEASGGKVGEESIIEIAIYRYNGEEVVDQFISLVNPQKDIDVFVQRLTGITNKMVVTAPKFHEVAKRIIEITSGTILVGHNVEFDYRMLRQEYDRLGYKFEIEWIDTFVYAERLIPGLDSYSLGKLCTTLGIPMSDRHRASGDARATLKLFQLLKDKDSEKTIMAKSTVMIPKNDTKKYEKLTEGLPNKIGNFYLYNGIDELVYVGSSANIAQHVRQMFAVKSFKNGKQKKHTRRIHFEVTGSELIARIKKIQEVEESRPKLNEHDRLKRVFPFGIYISNNKKGYKRLEVGKIRKQEAVLGFTTKAKATEALFEITRFFELCLSVNGLHKEEGECPQVGAEICKGACVKKENVRSYNERVEAFRLKSELPYEDFLLIDKGRKPTEKSFLFFEKGKLFGYGYFEYHHQIKSLKRIKKITTPVEETPDIRLMIRNYLYLENELEIVPIEREETIETLPEI